MKFKVNYFIYFGRASDSQIDQVVAHKMEQVISNFAEPYRFRHRETALNWSNWPAECFYQQ